MVSPKMMSLMLLMVPLAGSSRALSLDAYRPWKSPSLSRRGGHCLTNRLKTSSMPFPPCIRGGSSSILRNTPTPIMDRMEDHPNTIVSSEERWQLHGMSAALAATYLTVMAAKCALPSVLPLLISKNGLTFPSLRTSGQTPQGHMASLLGLSTLAVALGKLLLGPVTDAIGGIRALQVSLTLLMVLLATISCSQQFTLFSVSWILVDIIFSSCWAGCISAIHQSFPESLWGKQIGSLAVGARTGNTLSFALFGSMLFRLENTVKQPWRHVFAVSAALQLVPLALLAHFGGKTLKANRANLTVITQETKPSLQGSLSTLRREAGTPEFWLHLVSRSALMVFASFLLFVPTLMSQVYGFSNAAAAQCASMYSLGCLLSVTLGSSRYSNLTARKQALATVVLTTVSAFSSLSHLAHVSGILTLTPAAATFSIFLWGFAFSIPFYIPPSLYALSRGGKQSSATIADVFDVGGFALLAMFNAYVASINHANSAAWIPTFVLTTACALTSLASLPFAILKQ